MKNFKVITEYDGTRYSGWQKQGNTTKTIQYKFEEILYKMTGEKTEIFASGRTDSGVHAKGQVFNFKTKTSLSCEEIKKYFNTYLPEDIIVKEVKEVDLNFHSRLNAKKKTYCYKMGTRENIGVFSRKYITAIESEPDIELMKKGAEKLLGVHDFKGFSTKHSNKKTTVREIYSINIDETDNIISITITGSGFLYNMVRIICGTLYEIGTGKVKCDIIDKIFESKTRNMAGPTMPPKGLCLEEVFYKED